MAESLDHVRISRRAFIPAAGMLVTAACSSDSAKAPQVPSAVFIAKAASYQAELEKVMEAGITACGLAVKGKSILLKPNLVEFDSSTAINTNVAVIAAAAAVFTKLGAATVRIGEGPGHRRDTTFLADEAEYRSLIPKFDDHFIDLNRDDVSPIKNFAGREELYFPNSALAADLIVSLAKMKTHHWAGATLSMKNFFGLVPGSIYGWPKNVLHQIGIAPAIVELGRKFPKSFAIVDGIVGMEGNGPIQGTAKPAGVMVMGSDLRAVDSTCCRIMGINPAKLDYLKMSEDLGQIEESRIEQRGESINSVRTQFALIERFLNVRLA